MQRRAYTTEILGNLAFIVAVPVLARLAEPWLMPIAWTLGFGDFANLLTGFGGATDIGWEVAASLGLLSPDISAYATLTELDPLIGMGQLIDWAQTHPPTALIVVMPLTLVDYHLWVSFWIPAMIVMIAVSMRIMSVPAWVAYPVAVAIAVTQPGLQGLGSTYPVIAVLVALAWRYRTNPAVSGTALAVLTASRGIGGLLLLYPVVKRRWSTVVLAAAILVVLSALALIIEPDVISNFTTNAMASVEFHLHEKHLVTLGSIAGHLGLPSVTPWIIAAAVLAGSIALKRELFWVLLWVTFAVSPLAWTQSFIMGIPLVVAMWQTGKLGRFLTLVLAIPIVSGLSGLSMSWIAFVVITGVGVLICPIGLVGPTSDRALAESREVQPAI